jgi:hypothetical protein
VVSGSVVVGPSVTSRDVVYVAFELIDPATPAGPVVSSTRSKNADMLLLIYGG